MHPEVGGLGEAQRHMTSQGARHPSGPGDALFRIAEDDRQPDCGDVRHVVARDQRNVAVLDGTQEV
jgi:hypothetical protein